MDTRINFRTGLIFFLIFILLVGGFACAEKKIKVRTGTRIICKYGELIKDNTKYLSVPASKASRYSVRTIRRLCKRHKRIENLHRIAQQALAEGNELEAKKAVEQILKQEPKIKRKVENVEDTKTKVEIIGQAILESERRAESAISLTSPAPGEAQSPTSGQSQQETSSQQEASSPPEGGQPGPSVTPANLLSIFPADLPGYSMISETKSILAASRLYDAFNNPRVKFLTIVAQQFGNKKEVQGWIDSARRLHYSADGQNVRIGNSVVYFGTDGREFAYAGWAKDNILVELEMLAQEGVSPKNLYDDIIDVVEKI